MDSKDSKTDLRVLKTLSSLTSALEQLLTEKDLDDITVKELCERARTRKATFYNHFADKNDLFSYMILGYMHSSEETGIVPNDPDDPADYYSGIFRYLLDFLENNEAMARQMLKGSASHMISELYMAQMEPIITVRLERERENGNVSIVMPELLSAMISGAVLEGGRHWFSHKDSLSKDTATKQFALLISSFFEGASHSRPENI